MAGLLLSVDSEWASLVVTYVAVIVIGSIIHLLSDMNRENASADYQLRTHCRRHDPESRRCHEEGAGQQAKECANAHRVCQLALEAGIPASAESATPDQADPGVSLHPVSPSSGSPDACFSPDFTGRTDLVVYSHLRRCARFALKVHEALPQKRPESATMREAPPRLDRTAGLPLASAQFCQGRISGVPLLARAGSAELTDPVGTIIAPN